MAKFSEEERAEILAEAQETLERLERLETERDSDDTVTRSAEDWIERWKREAARQEERQMPLDQNLTDTEAARLEAKFTKMLDDQKKFVMQEVAVGVARELRELRDGLVAEVTDAFSELHSELAELRKARGGKDDDDKGSIIDLPPLPRHLQ